MSFFGRLATVSYRHRWLVVLGWVVGLVLVLVFGRVAAGAYATQFSIPASESQKAQDLLTTRFPARSGSSAQIIFATSANGPTLDTPDLASRVTAILAQAASLPDVTGVTAPSTATTSTDNHTSFATVQYGVQANVLSMTSAKALVGLVDQSGTPGLTV